jgi:hypothetical protein
MAFPFFGCGYTMGFRPRAGIQSIAVPIFENKSLRRELEFPLTEAVVREIQRRTPLRITSPDKADWTLHGTIESFDQPVLVEGQQSTVLESSAVVSLGVVAVDREGRTVFRYTGPHARPGTDGPALVESAQFPPIQGNAQGVTLVQPTADVFVLLAERVVMLLEDRVPRPPGRGPGAAPSPP